MADHDMRAQKPVGNGRTGTIHAAIDDAVERVRFGTILLTVHDGRVVQLDVTERQRFI